MPESVPLPGGSSPRHQLGILLVHGIGEQPEGSTLLSFGEPILRWLRAWLSRGAEGGAHGALEIVDAKVTPSKSGPGVPAHSRVDVSVVRDGVERSSSWLIAESWWGREVQPPPFGKLAGWMLTVGAWATVSHAAKRALARKQGTARIAAIVGALALSLPIAVLLQFAVFVLSILALVPIPRLRKALSGMLLTLTGVLGDSYVLIESELQSSAIINRTRDTLVWLAADCEAVIVLAHSQGAAVAHQALRSSTPSNVRLLLTFGSGLGKLEELILAKKTSGLLHATAQLVPLLFLLVALIVYITRYEKWDDISAWAVTFVLMLIVMGSALILRSVENHWAEFRKQIGHLSLSSARRNLEWIDIYASHDLVPNGAITPPECEIAGLSSRDVVNLRSWAHDHTAYWLNRCEFIPHVIRAIDRVAGLHLFTESDEKALDDAAQQHRRNVRWLTMTRWGAWASVAALFYFSWDSLLRYGRTLHPWLGTTDSRLGMVLATLDRAAQFMLPFVSRDQLSDAEFGLLGATIPVLLVAGWQYCYGFVWRWWDGRAIERVFRPHYLSAAVDRAAIALFVLSVGFLPLLGVLVVPYKPAVSVGHVVAGLFFAVYALFVLVVLARFAINAPSLVRKVWRNEAGWRADLTQELTGAGLVAIMSAMFLTMLVPDLKVLRDAGTTGLIAVFYVGLLFRLQTALIKRVQRIVHNTVVARAVGLSPIVGSVAVAAFARPVSLVGLAGAYAILLLLAHALAWLVIRFGGGRAVSEDLSL